jgi:glutamine amidotransferase
VLGICLGLQILFESSTEHEGAAGIGVLRGEVTGLDAPGLKVPHMGWEPVRWERESELVSGLESGTPFYFVHSFAVRPADLHDVLGTAKWGERFACAVARPPVYGVQFHPEKSSTAGLRVLANFAEICASVPA